MPFHGGSPYKIMKNIIYTYMNRTNEGINHVTGDVHYCILGLIGCKSVLTVHDLVWLEYLKLGIIKSFLIKLFYIKLPMFFATKVVAISESTKIVLQKYTKRKDIRVIHNAIDPSFIEVPKDLTKKPYDILFIGTNSNKNLERTVHALREFDCRLTIIGKLSEKQLKCLDNSHIKYISKSNLTDKELFQEYVNCDIVSFISLYEGFGMPIIEANKVGRPVIASSLAVLKEIGGDSCVYVNPKNVEEMKKGFIHLFEDAKLRCLCVERGFDNVKRFELKNILSQWIQLYQELK